MGAFCILCQCRLRTIQEGMGIRDNALSWIYSLENNMEILISKIQTQQLIMLVLH